MAVGRELLSSQKLLVFLLFAALLDFANADTSPQKPGLILPTRNRGTLCTVVTSNSSYCCNCKRILGRGKVYFSARFLHTKNGTSSFQLCRIILAGDIHTNPGPIGKRNPKYPCKECGKAVRSNQDVILCAECNIWSHAKCLGLTKAGFKYYLDHPEIDWKCLLCSLPFRCENYIFEVEEENKSANSSINNSKEHGEYANEEHLDTQGSQSILAERKNNSSSAFIMHLNINSIQNKFEELKQLNDCLKAHVIVLSETKIDSSYPSSQFSLSGYNMFRKDRKKGGGGLIAYFSASIPSRKLVLPKTYKTLEAIAVESKIGRTEVLFLAIYRPPKQSGKDKKSAQTICKELRRKSMTYVSGRPFKNSLLSF